MYDICSRFVSKVCSMYMYVCVWMWVIYLCTASYCMCRCYVWVYMHMCHPIHPCLLFMYVSCSNYMHVRMRVRTVHVCVCLCTHMYMFYMYSVVLWMLTELSSFISPWAEVSSLKQTISIIFSVNPLKFFKKKNIWKLSAYKTSLYKTKTFFYWLRPRTNLLTCWENLCTTSKMIIIWKRWGLLIRLDYVSKPTDYVHGD